MKKSAYLYLVMSLLLTACSTDFSALTCSSNLDISEDDKHAAISCEDPKWLVTCDKENLRYVDKTIHCTATDGHTFEIKDETASNPLKEKWTFNSEYFGYGFSLPKEAQVTGDCMMETYEECNDIDVYYQSPKSPFAVAIVQSSYYSGTEHEEEFRGIISSAETYAQRLWDTNVAEMKGGSKFNPNLPDKQVGKLRKIKFANTDAYTFTLTESFEQVTLGDGMHGEVLDDPSHVVVISHKGNILLIRYPQNNELAEAMANTFFIF